MREIVVASLVFIISPFGSFAEFPCREDHLNKQTNKQTNKHPNKQSVCYVYKVNEQQWDLFCLSYLPEAKICSLCELLCRLHTPMLWLTKHKINDISNLNYQWIAQFVRTQLWGLVLLFYCSLFWDQVAQRKTLWEPLCKSLHSSFMYSFIHLFIHSFKVY